MRVYHLLPEKWALEDLEKRRLKISFLEDLNDPFEFLSLNTSDSTVHDVLLSIRRKLGEQNGVLCFSQKWSNPVLWSHYGDKHKGIALGFDIPELVGEQFWINVNYVNERLDYTASALQTWKPDDMRKVLATKFEHWRYEDEVRIFSSIEEKDTESGLCFAPFSENLILAEVILGVRCEVTETKIQKVIRDIMPPIRVVKAKLDSSSFSIIE